MNRELLASFVVHKAVVLQIRGFPRYFFKAICNIIMHFNLRESISISNIIMHFNLRESIYSSRMTVVLVDLSSNFVQDAVYIYSLKSPSLPKNQILPLKNLTNAFSSAGPRRT
jgi:hypothetical protein